MILFAEMSACKQEQLHHNLPQQALSYLESDTVNQLKPNTSGCSTIWNAEAVSLLGCAGVLRVKGSSIVLLQGLESVGLHMHSVLMLKMVCQLSAIVMRSDACDQGHTAGSLYKQQLQQCSSDMGEF